MPRLGQRMAQARHDQTAGDTRISEPDLGFRRVHVDVHQHRVAIDEQRRGRVPVPAQHVHIGRAQRPGQQLVPHRATVDEQELRHRRAPRIGGQSSVAGHVQPLAFRVDAQGVVREIAPDDRRQPPVQRVEHVAAFGIGAEHHPALAAPGHVAQGETDIGRGHGQPLHHVGHRLPLCPVGAQEFQPRRRGEEKVAQLHHGPGRQRGGPHVLHPATAHRDLGRRLPRHA